MECWVRWTRTGEGGEAWPVIWPGPGPACRSPPSGESEMPHGSPLALPDGPLATAAPPHMGRPYICTYQTCINDIRDAPRLVSKSVLYCRLGREEERVHWDEIAVSDLPAFTALHRGRCQGPCSQVHVAVRKRYHVQCVGPQPLKAGERLLWGL